MDAKQIKDLIDQTIAGQGSMVDISGALPTILKEIVDMASAGANVQSDWDEADNTNPAYIKNKPELAKPIQDVKLQIAPFNAGDLSSLDDFLGYIRDFRINYADGTSEIIPKDTIQDFTDYLDIYQAYVCVYYELDFSIIPLGRLIYQRATDTECRFISGGLEPNGVWGAQGVLNLIFDGPTDSYFHAIDPMND